MPASRRSVPIPPGHLYQAGALAALTALLLGLPASCQAQAAAAQSAAVPAAGLAGATQVEEVVVTARHRTEKAQNVPIALTAIGSAKLAANGTTSLNQLAQLVPSLQVTEFNPRNTSFNIRGVGNNVSIANDGLESGVGVYVDNVFYSRPAQATFAFPDLDNIQVLRGPQGTLFGKNTTAGAIDVHTTLPRAVPDATLETSFGNYGFWQVKGTASDALTDKINARVSFLLDARDGTTTSAVSGQHYNTLDDKAVRVQLSSNPVDDLNLRFIADYAHQLSNCCVYEPVGVFTTLVDGKPVPFDFLQREALLGYHVPNYDPFSRKAAIDSYTFYEMETGGASLQADYELGGFNLTSNSAWRFWNWYPHNGAIDAIGIPVITNSNQSDYQRQASQELRLTSPTGGAVDYTGGLYFFYQDLPGALRTSYGRDAGEFLAGNKLPASLSNLIFNGLNVYGKTDPVTNSYAAYNQATWHAVNNLDLTGGLRYTYEDKSGSYDQYQFGGPDLSALSPGLQKLLQRVRNTLGAPLYYNDHTHNGEISYLLTATYHLDADALVYATYSRGNKSAGINVTNLPTGVNPIVKPERVDDYELGVKSSWFDNRLVANADVFWIEDTDYQGIAIAPLGAGVYTAYIANVPKVRSRGFELDTHATPFDWLSLNWSAAYTEAIYESYTNGQCPPEVSGSASEICNLTGRAVPGTSRWVTSLGGDAHQGVGSFYGRDVQAYVGADFTLRSSFNVNASDSIYAQVPGYGLLNARLGLRTADGKYDAYLWSHNATNTRYYQVIGAAQPFSGLIDGIPGDPLTWGVTLRVHL
jgi:iron complex outermembrane receptor protein